MNPERAAVLHARAHDALAELMSLDDHDPAARPAMHAVHLTQRTLERFWLPPLANRIERGR